MWNICRLSCLILLLNGCATVDVHRVNESNNTAEGFRYYLPRPFIAVKKPFPVEYQEHYISGRVVGDQIELDLSKANEDFKNFGFSVAKPTNGAEINPHYSLSDVFVNRNITVDGQRAGEAEKGASDGETPGKGDEKPGQDGEKEPAKVAAPAPGQSVASLNEFFDVLYLPDFSQQYTIDFQSGLGKSTQSIKLHHGWMLTDYAGETDNSEVLASIGNFVGSMVSAASGLAGLGDVPGDGDKEEPEKQEDPPNGETGKQLFARLEDQDKRPVSVTIRAMVTLNALPGTYPVLKPTEIASYTPNPGPHSLLVPNPGTAANVPFAILYKVQATLRLELVSVETTPRDRAQ